MPMLITRVLANPKASGNREHRDNRRDVQQERPGASQGRILDQPFRPNVRAFEEYPNYEGPLGEPNWNQTDIKKRRCQIRKKTSPSKMQRSNHYNYHALR